MAVSSGVPLAPSAVLTALFSVMTALPHAAAVRDSFHFDLEAAESNDDQVTNDPPPTERYRMALKLEKSTNKHGFHRLYDFSTGERIPASGYFALLFSSRQRWVISESKSQKGMYALYIVDGRNSVPLTKHFTIQYPTLGLRESTRFAGWFAYYETVEQLGSTRAFLEIPVRKTGYFQLQSRDGYMLGRSSGWFIIYDPRKGRVVSNKFGSVHARLTLDPSSSYPGLYGLYTPVDRQGRAQVVGGRYFRPKLVTDADR